MKMELDYIEQLAKLVKENDLTELTLEDGEKALIIKKEVNVITAQTAPVAHVQASLPSVHTLVSSGESVKEIAKGTQITSPMVGTFYKASSPGSAPFAEVGKTINAGQAVCIIEAMKLMNEIESEVSGKVIEILVEDGQPVEFGQVLMVVEPQ